MTTIVTPRPPLNIFDRARIDLTNVFSVVYETPIYQVPAVGPNPQKDVEAVALLTSLIVANTTSDFVELSVRIGTSGVADRFTLVQDMLIPTNDFALINLGKQNLPSGDFIEAKVNTNQFATAHLSFVLNQREEYEVISS